MNRVPVPGQIRQFVKHEAAGGVLLLTAAIIALIWANSPWDQHYQDLWATKISIGTGRFHLTESLLHWINDGLMAIFFLMVGLEIKRELLVGELASPRRAALPAIAALGGVLVPAGIYLLLNSGRPGEYGWGIPMATDIAFVVGILAVLGNRIPLGLKVFLIALAIVDDIAAVAVIAVFYTGAIAWESMAWAGLFLIALGGLNWFHIRHPLPYGLLGIGLWVAVFSSGVHATVAGVLLALMIPASTRYNAEEIVDQGRSILDRFNQSRSPGVSILSSGKQQDALSELEELVEGAGAPLYRLEHNLDPWVSFLIVPLFALANAGVSLNTDQLSGRVAIGVVLGLVVGKQVGITLFTLAAVRLGITRLPRGVSMRQVYGASCLAGIGFTMSLFVTDLAFGDPDQDVLRASAKIGILAASLVAGMLGWVLLSARNQPIQNSEPTPETGSD